MSEQETPTSKPQASSDEVVARSSAAPELLADQSGADDLVPVYLADSTEAIAADMDQSAGTDVSLAEVCQLEPTGDTEHTPDAKAETDPLLAILATETSFDEAASDTGEPTDDGIALEPALAEATAENAFVSDVEDEPIELVYEDEIAPAEVAVAIESPAIEPEPVVTPAVADVIVLDQPPVLVASEQAMPAAVADDAIETSEFLSGSIVAVPALVSVPEPAEPSKPAARRRRSSALADPMPAERPSPRIHGIRRPTPPEPQAIVPTAEDDDDALSEAVAEDLISGSDELGDADDPDGMPPVDRDDYLPPRRDDIELIPPSAVSPAAEDEDDDDAEMAGAGSRSVGGGWTIPLLCAGIALIACCMVIPQADANRRLAYQRSELRAQLDAVQQQVATNDEFLQKLASDPTLAERLAQRQMKMVRSGVKPLPVSLGPTGTSPFELVQIPAPAKQPPYEPIGGRIATLTYHPRVRLYLTGGGLLLLAAGLVLGAGGRRHPAD